MEEYRDYRFHIRQSCIGMALGLPACLAVGALTAIFLSVEKRYRTDWVQYSQGNLFQELLTLNQKTAGCDLKLPQSFCKITAIVLPEGLLCLVY